MTVAECIETRRSIRRYRPDPIDHSLRNLLSHWPLIPLPGKTHRSPVYCNRRSSLLKEIADRYTPEYNANIIRHACADSRHFHKGRCGFERDGSFSTKKEDRWQMFDAGAACQTFCLAAKDKGLGTVIMGIFDEDGISERYIFQRSRNLAH